jgi:hypothetical protein
MEKKQKRRTARRRSTPAGRPKSAKNVERQSELGPQRLCWLCSQPLTSGEIKSMLGRGVFEVHQRCYEEALRA